MLRWLFIAALVLSFCVTGWNGEYFNVYNGMTGMVLNGIIMLLGYAVVKAVLYPFRRRKGERPASPDPSPENM